MMNARQTVRTLKRDVPIKSNKLVLNLALIFALSITLFIKPSVSAGYEVLGTIWSLGADESVPYRINETLSADIADGPCLAAIQAGFESWSAISCSYLTWSFMGRTTNRAWGANDGDNVVSWREVSWDDSAAALAITSTIFDLRGFIDTDIKYNGFHHTWAIVGAGEARGTDVEGVTAHEVGHALGLDHSTTSGATMWPSTGPNDQSSRSLAQDDIEGLCALYPSGGEAPTVVDEPLDMEGSAEFGESCSDEACAAPFFCVSDGLDQLCTETCDPARPCPDDYYCAQLSSGSGACARGEPPMRESVGFNETCGDRVVCEVGLLCVSAGGDRYCSYACDQGQCPDGFSCAGLSGGGDICARTSAAPAPELGEPCATDGLCASGLFCLTDPLYTSAVSGAPIPYCSSSCDLGCPRGYRCAELGGLDDACQRIPATRERNFGDECWINPEDPYLEPTCGDELRCVGTRRDPNTQAIIEPGHCTSSCEASRCCPEGWGCAAVTPFLALCAEGVSDDSGFVCVGERPTLDRPSVMGTGSDEVMPDLDRAGTPSSGDSSMSISKDQGCQQPRGLWGIDNPLGSLCVLALLMLYLRALRRSRSA